MRASLTGKALILSIGSALQKLSSFVLIILLVRLLDKAAYGTYQQLFYIGAIVYGLFVASLSAGLYYYLPRLDLERRRPLVWRTVLLMFVLGAGTGLLLVLVRNPIAGYTNNPELGPLLVYYAVYVVFWIASDFFLHLLNAYDQFLKSALFATLEAVVNATFISLPLVWGGALDDAILWLAAAGGLRYLLYLLITRRIAGPVNPWQWEGAAGQVRYSFPLMAAGWADLAGGYLDKVFVSVLYTPATLAIYAIGTLPLPLWEVIARPVNIVLRVKFSELLGSGRDAEVFPIWREAVRKQAALVLPILFLLWVLADRLIPLVFTDAYRESVAVFRIYLLDKPWLIMSFSVFPLTMGRPDFLFRGSVVFVIANAVLMSLVAKRMGIYGPILALVSAQYIHYGTYVYLINRHLGIPLLTLFPAGILLRVFAANLIAAVLAYAVAHSVGRAWLALVLGGLAYALAYVLLLQRLGLLHAEEKRRMLALLQAMRRWRPWARVR